LVYSPADVDQEELTDAGVICVRAAGNYYHKIELPGGDDYDNNYTYSGNFALGIITAGNPIYYHRGGSPWSSDTILVSNVDNTNYDSAQEQMAASSERGPGVYISAPGTQITSATSQGADYASKQVYPGNSNYYIARISGTSMAAPQVTGMLALFLQLNPAATSQQCKDWLSNFGSKEVMYATGLNDDYADSRSLMGQSRRFAYFPFAKDLGSRVNGAIVRK
jgi:subtilisin family serine protease